MLIDAVYRFSLADSIALGTGRAAIETRRLAFANSRDMGANAMFAHVRGWGDEILHVIALVGTQRLGVNATPTGSREQRSGGPVFGLCRLGDENIHAQPVAIFHEDMSAVAELGGLAVALSHEAGVRIGRALMSGVRALFTLKTTIPVLSPPS